MITHARFLIPPPFASVGWDAHFQCESCSWTSQALRCETVPTEDFYCPKCQRLISVANAAAVFAQAQAQATQWIKAAVEPPAHEGGAPCPG